MNAKLTPEDFPMIMDLSYINTQTQKAFSANNKPTITPLKKSKDWAKGWPLCNRLATSSLTKKFTVTTVDVSEMDENCVNHDKDNFYTNHYNNTLVALN